LFHGVPVGSRAAGAEVVLADRRNAKHSHEHGESHAGTMQDGNGPGSNPIGLFYTRVGWKTSANDGRVVEGQPWGCRWLRRPCAACCCWPLLEDGVLWLTAGPSRTSAGLTLVQMCRGPERCALRSHRHALAGLSPRRAEDRHTALCG
jgi:hypothetical protein